MLRTESVVGPVRLLPEIIHILDAFLRFNRQNDPLRGMHGSQLLARIDGLDMRLRHVFLQYLHHPVIVSPLAVDIGSQSQRLRAGGYAVFLQPGIQRELARHIRLSVVAHHGDDGIFQHTRLFQRFEHDAYVLIQAEQRRLRLLRMGAVQMPCRVQVHQMDGQHIRHMLLLAPGAGVDAPRSARIILLIDQLLRDQGSKPVKVRLLRADPLPAVLKLIPDQPPEAAVSEDLGCLVLPRQGMNFRKIIAYRGIMAADRLQDRGHLAPGAPGGLMKGGHLYILRVPMPGPFCGRQSGHVPLIVRNAVLVRIAARDDAGMDRIG